MLAFKFGDHLKKISYPIFMQPKLNGIRMNRQEQVMQSSSRGLATPKRWPEHRMKNLRKELADFPSHILTDGEIYKHGWSLQKINGAASINGLEDTERTNQLEYHIFDVIDINNPYLPFSQRHELLRSLNSHYSNLHVKFVETLLVQDLSGAEAAFSRWKSEGYEGAMYRFDAPYGFASDCTNQENRWARLLKRKDWLDQEFLCTGVERGEGKYSETLGALVCDCAGRAFNVGTGFSDAERNEFWSSLSPVGKLIRIKFEMFSDSGVPLKPVFEAIIED